MCSPVIGTRGVACTNSREDCAIVAAVRVVTLAINARVELELGPLAHVRHGESGLGGIGACVSSGIVSASWSVSLASESSSESVTKADSLGREDGRTWALSFLGGSSGGFSGEGISLTFAVIPDKPDADKFLASLAEVHSPPVVVVVGLSSARLLDRAVARQGLGGIQRFATLGSATRSAAVSRGWV